MHKPPDKDGFFTVQTKKKQNPTKGNQQNPNKGIPGLQGSQANSSLGASTSQKKTIKDVLQSEVVYTQKHHLEEVLTLALEDLKLHSDAWGLKARYFGTQNYMVQEGRMRYYYENILIETILRDK